MYTLWTLHIWRFNMRCLTLNIGTMRFLKSRISLCQCFCSQSNHSDVCILTWYIYIYMPYDANLYYSLMHEPISWYMTLRNGCEHIIKPSTLVFLVYFRCRFTMVSQAAEPAWQHLFFLVAQANSSWTHDGILLAYGVWVEWDLSFFPPVHLMASGKSWQRERRLLAYGLRIRIYRKFSQN